MLTDRVKRAFPGRRALWGCFYLGCIAPITFTVLTGLILLKAITNRLKGLVPPDD